MFGKQQPTQNINHVALMSTRPVSLKPYLIPRNVRTRWELYPGYGVYEIKWIAIWALIGLGIALFLGLLTDSFFRFLTVIFMAMIPVRAFRPYPDGSCWWTNHKIIRRWQKRKKRLYAIP